MDTWLRSKLFERSGLDAAEIRAKVIAECRSAGDFLRIVMEEICRRQNMWRWADCTPEHLLYIREIKKAFPGALVIHIIRDGRDVALSLEKQHWISPLSSADGSGLLAAGLFWEWIVEKGRNYGLQIGTDYLEVRFKDVVEAPRETLRTIGAFIEHDLDHERIQETAIGSVSKPNTSFEFETKGTDFAPVGRWKRSFPPGQLAQLEGILGPALTGLGFSVSQESHRRVSFSALRRIYRLRFEMKLQLKRHTPVGRLTSLAQLELP